MSSVAARSYPHPYRGLYPPLVYPYPAHLEVPWDQVSTNSSSIVARGTAGIMTAPVSFDAVVGQHSGYHHGIVPSSTSGWMNSNHATWAVQQGSRDPVVRQPGQGISGNTAAVIYHAVDIPAMQNANVDVPVIRRTIGTPAMISSADKRRVRPRKHGCHICSSMFTSKENRDRKIDFIASPSV